MSQDLLPDPSVASPADRTPDVTAPVQVRVFVNERGVSVPRGATALDAVRVADAALGEALADGRQRLTDSRGLPIEPAAVVHGGAIYRLLPVRASAEALLAERPEASA